MSDFKVLSLDGLCEKIKGAKSPVIALHRAPDGDAVGCAAAMYYIFKQMGRTPTYICADKIPKRLEFLCPELTEADLSSLDGCDIICVDVASRAQLGKLGECVEQLKRPYLMIDHHAIGEAFADNYIRPDACACAEIIYDLACALIKDGCIDEITKETASAIYAAISSDGGCFKYSNVTPKTHKIAASLIECGIDTAKINRLLFDSKSNSQIRAEGFTATKMKSYLDGALSLACITRAEREALGLSFADFETAIDVVRSLEGIKVSCVIKQQDDGIFKVSMRSSGADVASVCAGFGGGGHTRAAGCSLSVDDESTATELVKKAIEKII